MQFPFQPPRGILPQVPSGSATFLQKDDALFRHLKFR